MSSKDALYLVDGSGFVFRAYHALSPLSTRSGQPTGAVYGFTQMLIKLEVDHRPRRLAIVFDAGARSFRNNLYNEYKAHRPEPPDDLKPQFALVRQAAAAFAIPVIEAVDFEADDIIATLARRARNAGERVVIVSSDKDLMQLVDENCVLIDTMKDITYGPSEVAEKFGVGPAQLGDVLALMGDSVDNVPGVPGIGPKTASILIRHFGSLEALLQKIDQVPSVPGLRGAKSVAEKLRLHLDQARLSRRLVALDEAVAIPIEDAALERKEPDMAEVDHFLVEMEFTRLRDRLQPKGSPPANGSAIEQRPSAIPDQPTAIGHPPLSSVLSTAEPEIITTENWLYAFAGELARARSVGLTIVTTEGPSHSAALIGIGLSIEGRFRPVYVPIGHRYLGVPTQLTAAAVFTALNSALASPRSRQFVHGSKEVELVLTRHGGHLGPTISDPMIASYLLEPAAPHQLSALAKSHLSTELEDRAALCGTGKRALPLETIEVGRVAGYASLCAEATRLVGEQLDKEIGVRHLTRLYTEIELPLSRVLARIEAHGVRIDVGQLRRLSEEVGEKLQQLEHEVHRLTGTEVNLGSPKQLQELLFGKLGLPPSRKTKTGYSVDADVLEELAPLHPAADKILEHRTLAKLKGTYLDALPALVDPKTGRLHTSFEQTIAATGRLSSTDPNLQNVPIRTELGREIRRAFIADPGHVLVVADYSQIELRVLAHLSSDAVLTDAFQKGQDIHERTVVEMFGEARASDPELRRVAKMINYGIIYGLSDFGLAQRLRIDRADARRYIDGYLRTYSGVQAYMEKVIEQARSEGGTRTLLGRFRPLPELQSNNRNVRMYGERMARNTPIQGTAADLLKLAMIAVQKFIDEESPSTRMLLTVHDELVLETPTAEAPEMERRLQSTMQDVMPLSVPLVVDVGSGPTWADAK